MYLRIGPKTRTNRRLSKTRPDAQTDAQKEDVSVETWTYGNPNKRGLPECGTLPQTIADQF